MNSSIVVTATQIPVSDYIEKNVQTLTKVIQDNKESDWILTPEASLSGYCQPPNLQSKSKEQIEKLHSALKEIETVQRSSEVGLLLGTGMIEQDGMPRNQQRVYNKYGDIISVYNKRLLTRTSDGGETHVYLPGYTPSIFPLDENGRVLGASLICNDAWATPRVSPEGNPYLINECARLGAEIVFVSAMCNVMDFDQTQWEWHDINLRMLAKDNDIFIVVSNSNLAMGWGPNDVYDSSTEFESKAVDRVQVNSGIIAPTGEWIAKCKDYGEDSVTMELIF